LQSLRIVAINTGKCDGDYRRRIVWLACELSELRPDIVACQEVFRDESGRLDTAALLASQLEMHSVWTPARFKERECEGRTVAGWSGMALLSRTPLTMFDSVNLPADERDGERRAQVCLLEADDAHIVVGNLHLTHLKDADPLRAQQLRRVLMHPLMNMKGAFRLLCGDFNTRSDGTVLGPLLRRWQHGHLEDAYLSGGGGSPNRATLASGRCVDYMLSLADSACAHPAFCDSAVVLNRPHPAAGVFPSDHFGVATTMLTTAVSQLRSIEQAAFVG
jgi:endonuclease/exonuclease/phosphatase family metal-dependent hydrolase